MNTKIFKFYLPLLFVGMCILIDPAQAQGDPERMAIFERCAYDETARIYITYIILIDPETGVETEIQNFLNDDFCSFQATPTIGSGYALWRAPRNGNLNVGNIHYFSLKERTVRQLTDSRKNQVQPKIAERAEQGANIVAVWSSIDRHDVVTLQGYDFTINRRLKNIYTANGDTLGVHADIHGNTIVFRDNVGCPAKDYCPQIFVYDLITQTIRQVTDADSAQSYPAIGPRHIAWYNSMWPEPSTVTYARLDDLDTHYDINFNSSANHPSAVDIEEDGLVFSGIPRSSNDFNLFYYDLKTEELRQITDDNDWPVYSIPHIYNFRGKSGSEYKILWAAGEFDDYLIYEFSSENDQIRKLTSDPNFHDFNVSYGKASEQTDGPTSGGDSGDVDPGSGKEGRTPIPVAWVDNPSGLNFDIYMSIPLKGHVPIAADPNIIENNPSISENILVWVESGDIHGYDISTGGQFRVDASPNFQQNPDVDGNIVVWQEFSTSSNTWDIIAKDLSTGTRISVSSLSYANEESPGVSGDKIVWHDDRTGNWNIYVYEISTGIETPVSTHRAKQLNPKIYGDWVVWEDDRNGNWDVRAKSLSTGVEIPVTQNSADQLDAHIYGDYIVYEDYQDGINIFLFSLITFEEYQLTNDPFWQHSPDITDGFITWTQDKDFNNDIILFDLSTRRHTRVTYDSTIQAAPAI